MFKLLKILIVSSVYFILISGIAEATKKKKWYDSVNVTGGITVALQGTSGNDDTTAGTEDTTDFSYSLDLNLNSEIARGHKFFVHIETGEGNGINDNFTTNINPNYDPFNIHNPDTGHQDITISKLFYEGTFIDEMLIVDFGKMDIHSFTDQNNFAGDETTQFMAGIFVRQAGTLFAELDNYYGPGIRFLFSPHEWSEYTYIVANSSFDSISKNKYHAVQMNFKPNIMDLKGNYRFYFISDGRDYTKIDDSSSDSNSNFGWGISFDQFVTENIGLFLRYGSQKGSLQPLLSANPVTSSLSGGMLVNGNMWKRSDDFAGLGLGTVKKNEKIAAAYSGNQKVVELFYHFQLMDNLSITPDIQFHKNLPKTDMRDIIIYGVRLQFGFF